MHFECFITVITDCSIRVSRSSMPKEKGKVRGVHLLLAHLPGSAPAMVLLVFHSSLLTEKRVNLLVAYDGFLCITEIIRFFHSGYIDYRGTFQTVLD